MPTPGSIEDIENNQSAIPSPSSREENRIDTFYSNATSPTVNTLLDHLWQNTVREVEGSDVTRIFLTRLNNEMHMDYPLAYTGVRATIDAGEMTDASAIINGPLHFSTDHLQQALRKSQFNIPSQDNNRSVQRNDQPLYAFLRQRLTQENLTTVNLCAQIKLAIYDYLEKLPSYSEFKPESEEYNKLITYTRENKPKLREDACKETNILPPSYSRPLNAAAGLLVFIAVGGFCTASATPFVNNNLFAIAGASVGLAGFAASIAVRMLRDYYLNNRTPAEEIDQERNRMMGPTEQPLSAVQVPLPSQPNDTSRQHILTNFFKSRNREVPVHLEMGDHPSFTH